MTLLFSHHMIPFAIPLLVGAVAALLVGGFRRPWPLHAGACLAAWGVSVVLQYCYYLVVGGILTGDWPDPTDLAGLLGWLMLFVVIASATAIPLSLCGYFGCLAILSQRVSGRPAE